MPDRDQSAAARMEHGGGNLRRMAQARRRIRRSRRALVRHRGRQGHPGRRGHRLGHPANLSARPGKWCTRPRRRDAGVPGDCGRARPVCWAGTCRRARQAGSGQTRGAQVDAPQSNSRGAAAQTVAAGETGSRRSQAGNGPVEDAAAAVPEPEITPPKSPGPSTPGPEISPPRPPQPEISLAGPPLHEPGSPSFVTRSADVRATPG